MAETFSPSWRTSTVLALAQHIRAGDYSILGQLADALSDAGCDDPTLSHLREEGIISPLSGLWLEGIEGKDGLWEWGQPVDDAMCGRCKLARTARDWGVAAPVCPKHDPLRSRRAELQRLHTGPCPTCGDRRFVFVDDDEFAREYGAVSAQKATDCPTCPTRERWDSAPCPGDPDGHNELGTYAVDHCEICGGSGDLLLMPRRATMRGRTPGQRDAMILHLEDRPRPLSFDLGPLPVVSARVEEIGREERCPCVECDLTPRRLRKTPGPSPTFTRLQCQRCNGRGWIPSWVPSEWLRSLPEWYDVMTEGSEPHPNGAGQTWYNSERHEPRSQLVSFEAELPEWLFNLLEGYDKRSAPTRWKAYDSPTAARLELCRAIRRWRFTS